MNASLMKRLFRAVSAGSREDLHMIATHIIHEEEKKGHIQLAKELKSTLSSFAEVRPDAVFEFKQNSLTVLPKSKRNESPSLLLFCQNSCSMR